MKTTGPRDELLAFWASREREVLEPLEPRGPSTTGYGSEAQFTDALARVPDAYGDEPTHRPDYCDGLREGADWGQREAWCQGACAVSVVWIVILLALAERLL